MQGSHVRLRPLQRADSDLLYEWITTRDLLILNSAYWPVSKRDHETWLESMLTKRSDSVFFVIEDLCIAAPIGTCQLLNLSWINRNAELQIRIGRADSLGKGLGSEAVRLLVDFGFRDLNLHRVYLYVFATNTRAIRAYEKCGFVQEGKLREAAYIDGAFVDVLCMGVLRSDHE